MRLERTAHGDGWRAELSLGDGMTHILRAEQVAKLCVWIEELFPEFVDDARKPPQAHPSIRVDSGGEGEEGT